MLGIGSVHRTSWERKQGPGTPLPGKGQHVPWAWARIRGRAILCILAELPGAGPAHPGRGHLPVCARSGKAEPCPSLFVLLPSFQIVGCIQTP